MRGMTTSRRWLLGAVAAALLLAPPAPAEIVRLRDGTLVHGEIVDFDEAVGVTIERVDNGGVVSLRWEHLDAEEVRRIKASRGFTGEEPEPYRVTVTHLILRNGTTESGVLMDDGRRDTYALERRGRVDAFPRNFVRRVETGLADGLEVYRPEDLYEVIVDDLGAPADAAGHFELAVACEGAGLHERAREHYLAVRELDRDLKAELIETRLEQLAIRIEDAEETEFLAQIRGRLHRSQFEKALEMVEEFDELYPASRQAAERDRLVAEILRRRDDHYQARIVSDYFSFLSKSLTDIVRKDGMTVEVARQLAEESVHEEIVGRLANSYNLEREVVDEMWAERRGGSLRTRSYGTGTFILGDDALEWYEDEEEEAADVAAAEGDSFEQQIEDVLRRRQQEASQRQAASRSSRSYDDVGPTPDEWWAQATHDDRLDWLTAYFAETSGQLTIVRAKPRPCRTCDGEGTIDSYSERGEIQRVTCPTCKSLKIERLVSFR